MGEPAAPGIQIRLAGPGDAAALTELFDAVDRHYWGSAAPSPAAMAEHVRRRVLTATSCEIALAEMDGKPWVWRPSPSSIRPPDPAVSSS